MYMDMVFVAIGAAATGFGVAFWVYHKNKVAREFQALVGQVKDALKADQTTPPAA